MAYSSLGSIGIGTKFRFAYPASNYRPNVNFFWYVKKSGLTYQHIDTGTYYQIKRNNRDKEIIY